MSTLLGALAMAGRGTGALMSKHGLPKGAGNKLLNQDPDSGPVRVPTFSRWL